MHTHLLLTNKLHKKLNSLFFLLTLGIDWTKPMNLINVCVWLRNKNWKNFENCTWHFIDINKSNGESAEETTTTLMNEIVCLFWVQTNDFFVRIAYYYWLIEVAFKLQRNLIILSFDDEILFIRSIALLSDRLRWCDSFLHNQQVR